MSGIYNVKSISINGNCVDKIATNYNPYNRSKTTTLVSQKSLEEAIAANVQPCNYTFAEQHALNMMNGNIIVKEGNSYDITYNLAVGKFHGNFYYDSNCLVNVESKECYLAKTAKTFDSNETLYVIPAAELSYDVYPDYCVSVGSCSKACFEERFFGTEGLTFSSSWKNNFIQSGSKLINGVESSLTDADFTLTDDSEYVYTGEGKLLYNCEGNSKTFYLGNITEEMRSYDMINVKEATSINLYYAKNIETLYIGDFSVELQSWSSSLKDVYYLGNSLLISKIHMSSSGSLHTHETFEELGLSAGAQPYFYCGKIYLTSRFFNNVNLDTVAAGYFGDWSKSSYANVSELFIDCSNVYSSKTGDELKALIKTVMKLHDGITLTITE